ncbi:MAG: M20 family metallopeptidase [Asgard group archaeon]|nr:M20 family metallopeptidase [Asgard group archaeon]
MKKKTKVCEIINDKKKVLKDIALEIHANPELGFKEHTAVKILTKNLEKAGYKVRTGVADLPTAIRADYPAEKEGPTVAFLAEYDALPEIGHACGHNLIGTAALGAALGIAQMKKELPGKIVFLGTPAEEEGGGKVIMLEEGVFDDIDISLMFHPSGTYTMTGRGGLAMTPIEIEFFGKPAHAAADPEKGVSALDAVMLTFTGINYLREHIRTDARIHGIVKKGGVKPNIVPEYASAEFYVRAKDDQYRDEVLEKLINCAKGAALMTGAEMKWKKTGPSYSARKMNRHLGKAFEKNLEIIGEPIKPLSEDGGIGSSDIGNVSQKMPTIHPYIAICESEDVAGHSQDFAKAAASKKGLEAMITAAKALAMTAIDVLTDKKFYEEVQKEFKKSKK